MDEGRKSKGMMGKGREGWGYEKMLESRWNLCHGLLMKFV